MNANKEQLPVIENPKLNSKWVLDRLEISTHRYIRAEKFIIEILQMKWYQRLFLRKKIFKFLDECLTKDPF